LLRHGPEALLSAATAASAARQLLETTSNMCGGCCGCANRGVVSQMREVIVIRDA
jgi:methionine synthase I (cobalamin-dependent)